MQYAQSGLDKLIPDFTRPFCRSLTTVINIIEKKNNAGVVKIVRYVKIMQSLCNRATMPYKCNFKNVNIMSQ